MFTLRNRQTPDPLWLWHSLKWKYSGCLIQHFIHFPQITAWRIWYLWLFCQSSTRIWNKVVWVRRMFACTVCVCNGWRKMSMLCDKKEKVSNFLCHTQLNKWCNMNIIFPLLVSTKLNLISRARSPFMKLYWTLIDKRWAPHCDLKESGINRAGLRSNISEICWLYQWFAAFIHAVCPLTVCFRSIFM